MSNMNKENDYFIGLDIGTASVGWAVTNTNLDLIKKKKKNFWGSRLFDSGITAEARRLHRSSRRRYQRRRQRINLLQSLFEAEITKIDDSFYEKTNNSWISNDDETRVKVADFIFGKNQKKEKNNYYEQFPSIWHLRKHLIENSESKIDLRYLYLAIHHIIKYRGNFLYTDAEFQQTETTIEVPIDRLIEYLEETYEVDIVRDNFIHAIKNTLSDNNLTSAAKKDRLQHEFKDYKTIKRQLTQFINAILGYKANFSTLFTMDEKVDGYVKDGFDEEKFIPLREHLGTNDDLLDVIGQLYSWGILRKLLPDENNHFVSIEMVRVYNDYGRDLSELKQLFTEYLGVKEKNKFFKRTKSTKEKTYHNYNLSKKEVDLDSLYKEIIKKLKNSNGIANDKRYERLLHRIEDMSYLKVQNTTDKGAIPHQLHLLELHKIIENQTSFYPFLNTIKDKITSLLTFRIPYYVGPLNQGSSFAWIERTDEKIYPWNFDEVVNKEASEEKFIKKMISKCTYLIDKFALPLQSITYQEYILLNELNTVRVNNKKMSIETKLDALEQLFKKNNNVTITKFKNWLRTYLGENKSYEISGLSDEKKFNGSMSSWNQFTNIGIDLTNKANLKMVEEIILWSTIFSEKDTLKKRVERTYPELTAKQIKSIIALTFKGWGRLSHELLDGIYFTLPDGEKTTILERMRSTNQNFMQIINDKENGFATKLEDLMMETSIDKDVLTQIYELPGSPAIKKGIHQAILIVEEVKNIMGKEPKKIFIEFARESSNKKRTSSRYKQLEEVYKEISKENDSLFDNDIFKELKGFKNDEKKLDNSKIFLYFLQNGKCLYSGTKIEWQHLDSSSYEVDHIIPRSYTKDNSFSNLALVLREENQRKQDDLLLSESIIKQNKSWWSFLRKKGLITNKKYANLTRDKMTLNAQKGFINRQLVETRQISKHVKNLLLNLYPESKVQTLKAQFNSDYRKSESLYKLRSVNDYHHAHDAFLSIFLGEFIDRKLPWMNNYDPKHHSSYEKQIESIYSDRKVFNKDNRYGLLELIFKDQKKIDWDASKQNDKVSKYLNYKDCFITHKPEERSGEFYNQTLQVASTKKLIEQKKNRQTNIYGGYTNVNPAFFALVRNEKRMVVVDIPIHINEQIKKGLMSIKTYVKSMNDNYDIIRERVLINTKFELNDHPFIARSPKERVNGKQLTLPKSIHRLIYHAEHKLNYDEKQMDFGNFLNVVTHKLKIQYYELSGSERLVSLINNHLDELLYLSGEEMNVFITESLKFFQTNPMNPNFNGVSIDEFKKLKRFGRMNSINWSNNVALIDQSITGYYESRLEL